MMPFNEPFYVEKGIGCITEWFKERCAAKALLTISCTHALEMAALLADIQSGDDVAGNVEERFVVADYGRKRRYEWQ